MRRVLLVGLLGFGCSVGAEEKAPTSYDDFMREVNAGQRKIDYSETLINRNELDSLIIDRAQRRDSSGPKAGWLPDSFREGAGEDEGISKPPKPTPAVAGNDGGEGRPATSSKKTSEGDREESISVAPKPSKKPSSSPAVSVAAKSRNDSRVTKTVYLPPGLSEVEGVKNNIYVHSPAASIKFGIPIGTRIPVELRTGASNAQPGYIQLIVTENVQGDKRVLPKDSILFARGRSVPGTSRLHATVTRGITVAEHEEFTVAGIVFGDDGQAGFMGQITSDGRTFERAKDAGIYTFASGIISAVPGSDLAAEAGRRSAMQVLDEQQDESEERNGRARFIVEAEPQVAVLQVEETF